VGRRAIWWGRVHDCEEVLKLVGTWTSHTTADKIVTAGGVAKDALGVRAPKEILEGAVLTPKGGTAQTRATPARSRP